MSEKRTASSLDKSRLALVSLGKASKKDLAMNFLSSLKSEIEAALVRRASQAQIAATLSESSGLRISPRLIRELVGTKNGRRKGAHIDTRETL